MRTMNRPSIWQQAREEQLTKAGAKALRKGRPLKTYSPRDLQWYLEHGWKVISHTPSSYGQGQYWLLSQL